MEVTATVAFPEWDHEGGKPIEREIVDKAAKILADRIGEVVVTDIRDTLHAEVAKTVKALVKQVVSKEVPLTNHYGEATGKTRTLREEIVAEAKRCIEQAVDPKTGELSNYRGDNKISRGEFWVRRASRKVIEETYGEQIATEQKRIRAEMDDAVGAMLRKAIYEIAGIKALPAK